LRVSGLCRPLALGSLMTQSGLQWGRRSMGEDGHALSLADRQLCDELVDVLYHHIEATEACLLNVVASSPS